MILRQPPWPPGKEGLTRLLVICGLGASGCPPPAPGLSSLICEAAWHQLPTHGSPPAGAKYELHRGLSCSFAPHRRSAGIWIGMGAWNILGLPQGDVRGGGR